ncbi:MAG: hypothetical protein ACHQET_08175 [Chitinophagales bacterium]
MKKIILLLCVVIFAASANAQLAKSKWKGTLQLDNPIEVVFDFGKDSLSVYTVADNSALETMTFTDVDNVLVIKKVYGQSDCNEVEGKYKYEIKNEELVLTLVADDCAGRSQVLNNTKWSKSK